MLPFTDARVSVNGSIHVAVDQDTQVVSRPRPVLERIPEVYLDHWPRGVGIALRAEAQAAGERLRAPLDGHTVHVAGGIEAPAVEHGPGVPADASGDRR